MKIIVLDGDWIAIWALQIGNGELMCISILSVTLSTMTSLSATRQIPYGGEGVGNLGAHALQLWVHYEIYRHKATPQRKAWMYLIGSLCNGEHAKSIKKGVGHNAFIKNHT